MKIDILTLFPNMFKSPLDESIVKRALNKKLVEINIHDLRQWGTTERRNVDDRPFGGGPGMLMRVDVIDKALAALKYEIRNTKYEIRTILLDATGEKYRQLKAKELSKLDHLILIAGHYEGVDHRVHEHLVDEVLSIGDYVLTGGEIPAMVVVDSIIRLIPGVLGKDESSVEESHKEPGYLEHPHYTRPENYNGWKVPQVLLSGDHKKINEWRSGK